MDQSILNGSQLQSPCASRPDSPMLDASNLSFSTQLYDVHRLLSNSSPNFEEPSNLGIDHDMDTKFTPHTSNSICAEPTVSNASSFTDSEDCKKLILLPPPSQPAQKRKCILDLFPWLHEVTKINQQCLGSMVELKNTTILDAMDFLIGKLLDDYHDYYKSPKVAISLARYIRQFLYVYRHLYQCFELGKEYFKRMARILAIYTDLELCSSVLGAELDADTANRIQLIYRTHLEFAEEAVVLDVFINMKRLIRGHRGILNLILQYFLVKLTVQEPIELTDDLFIKYLIVFKKWLSVEEVMDDKENIRNAFITQVKPKKTLCMNTSYAPYLPADEEGSATIDNYVRMLDKKYSLEPLIRALEISEKNLMTYEELPSGIFRQISEVVILSDDEDEPATKPSAIKTEPIEPNDSRLTTSFSDLIDLTDEAFDETDVPRHYISWLSDLVVRAKIKPVTVDQRLEVATISSDIIVIDDDDNNKARSATVSSHDDNIAKVTHVDSPSSDSGCVIMNREEVGIHSNNNFDISQCSSDTGVEEEEVISEAVICENTANISGISDNDANAECLAHKHTLTDNNDSVHVAAGSISSCSEPAAEQLLTIINTPRLVADYWDKPRITTPTENVIKTVRFSGINRSVHDTDIINRDTIAATSSTKLIAQKNQPPSSISRKSYENLSTKLLVRSTAGEYLNAKEIDETGRKEMNDEEETSSFLMDVFGSKPVRPQLKNRSILPKNSCLKVVNPTRHTYGSSSSTSHANLPNGDWLHDDTDIDDLEDLSNYQQRKLQCSVPLSTIKTNSQLARNIGLNDIFRNTERIDDINDDDMDECEDDDDFDDDDGTDSEYFRGRPFTPYSKRSLAKSSPSQVHERSVRFADDIVTDIFDVDENCLPHARRRHIGKYDVPNLDETVPSTIQERKTYIKPATTNLKFNKKFTQTSSPRSLSNLSVIPTARSPPPPSFPLQQSHLSATHSLSNTMSAHESSPRSSMVQQTSQQQPSYRVFYSDEKCSFDTPYDQGFTLCDDNRCSPIPAIVPEPPKEPEEKNVLSNLSTSILPATSILSTSILPATSILSTSILPATSNLSTSILPATSNLSTSILPAITYQKIDGCYIRCDILDDKIFTTAVQLHDIYENKPQHKHDMILAAQRSNLITLPHTKQPRTRYPLPKFIVTKVTENKRTDKETVKFDIRNEIENKSENVSAVGYIKSSRKQTRKEIAEAHLMVQLQRRKSLRIFNKYDDTDATGTDSETDAETIVNKIIESDTDVGIDSEPNGFGRSNLRNSRKNKDTTNTEPELKQRMRYKKYRIKSVKETNPETNIKISLVDENHSSGAKPKAHSKSGRKKLCKAKTLTRTDVESEVENTPSNNRRKSKRKSHVNDRNAESEPELVLPFNRRKSLRGIYPNPITDDSETDGEIFAKGRNAAMRKDMNTMVSKSNKASKSNINPVPKKSNRGRKKKVIIEVEEKSPITNRKSAKVPKIKSKIERIRKSDKRLKQNPVVKLINLKISQNQSLEKPQNQLNEERPTNPCLSNFPPLPTLPDFNLLTYKQSYKEKSKSDVELKVSHKELFCSNAAKFLRRYSYSCSASTRTPIDYIYRVINQSDNLSQLHHSRSRSLDNIAKNTGGDSKNLRKRKAATTTKKAKRGRKANRKNGIRQNLTKKLLDSVDFSSLIDIAALNKKDVQNEDDMVAVYDSGSEIGDIEQQFLALRQEKRMGSLLTKSPLARRNLNTGKTTILPSESSIVSEQSQTANIITNLTATILPNNGNDEEITELIISKISQEEPEIFKNLPSSSTPCFEKSANENDEPTPLLPSPIIENDTNTVSSSNTLGELTDDKTLPTDVIQECKKKTVQDTTLNAEPYVQDNVSDVDDIESPAYEPHVSNSYPMFEDTLRSSAEQPIAKKRTRVKRTRGRALWSRPRRRPPIKMNDVVKVSTNSILPIPVSVSNLNDVTTSTEFNEQADVLNLSETPQKLLVSLPLQEVISQPKKRGRKRKVETDSSLIEAPKIVSKREQIKEKKTSQLHSLKIEPVLQAHHFPKLIFHNHNLHAKKRNNMISDPSSEDISLAHLKNISQRGNCEHLFDSAPVLMQKDKSTKIYEGDNDVVDASTVFAPSITAAKRKFPSMRNIQKRKAISLKK